MLNVPNIQRRALFPRATPGLDVRRQECQSAPPNRCQTSSGFRLRGKEEGVRTTEDWEPSCIHTSQAAQMQGFQI